MHSHKVIIDGREVRASEISIGVERKDVEFESGVPLKQVGMLQSNEVTVNIKTEPQSISWGEFVPVLGIKEFAIKPSDLGRPEQGSHALGKAHFERFVSQFPPVKDIQDILDKWKPEPIKRLWMGAGLAHLDKDNLAKALGRTVASPVVSLRNRIERLKPAAKALFVCLAALSMGLLEWHTGIPVAEGYALGGLSVLLLGVRGSLAATPLVPDEDDIDEDDYEEMPESDESIPASRVEEKFVFHSEDVFTRKLREPLSSPSVYDRSRLGYASAVSFWNGDPAKASAKLVKVWLAPHISAAVANPKEALHPLFPATHIKVTTTKPTYPRYTFSALQVDLVVSGVRA